MPSSDTLPTIGAALAPVLQRTPIEQRPILVALAERLAADRYREWARAVTDAGRSAELLACAAREEDIAGRVEALYADAAAVQRDLVAANPDVHEINRALFADRPLAQQFVIQAAGERLGAATWRSFAKHATDANVRDTFLACATLEEDSAACLERIVAS